MNFFRIRRPPVVQRGPRRIVRDAGEPRHDGAARVHPIVQKYLDLFSPLGGDGSHMRPQRVQDPFLGARLDLGGKQAVEGAAGRPHSRGGIPVPRRAP